LVENCSGQSTRMMPSAPVISSRARTADADRIKPLSLGESFIFEEVENAPHRSVPQALDQLEKFVRIDWLS